MCVCTYCQVAVRPSEQSMSHGLRKLAGHADSRFPPWKASVVLPICIPASAVPSGLGPALSTIYTESDAVHVLSTGLVFLPLYTLRSTHHTGCFFGRLSENVARQEAAFRTYPTVASPARQVAIGRLSKPHSASVTSIFWPICLDISPGPRRPTLMDRRSDIPMCLRTDGQSTFTRM